MTPTLIVTRPKDQGEDFGRAIAERWDGPLDIILSPLLRIVPITAKVDVPDALIFTSVNGVAAAQRLQVPGGLAAWCVGEKTAQAAAVAGYDPITGPGDATGLLAAIITAQPDGRLAHFRGKHARGDIAANLTQAGLTCADVVAYDQEELPLSEAAQMALAGNSPVIVPLFSPRTGMIFSANGPYQAKVHAVVISDAVKAVLEPLALETATKASQPDAMAMQDAVLLALKAAISAA